MPKIFLKRPLRGHCFYYRVQSRSVRSRSWQFFFVVLNWQTWHFWAALRERSIVLSKVHQLDQVSKIVARHVHCSTAVQLVTSRCFVTLLHNIPFTNQSWLPQTVLLHSSFHAHAVASKCPPQLPGGSPLWMITLYVGSVASTACFCCLFNTGTISFDQDVTLAISRAFSCPTL